MKIIKRIKFHSLIIHFYFFPLVILIIKKIVCLQLNKEIDQLCVFCGTIFEN